MSNFSNIARKCFDNEAYTLFIERSPEQKIVVKKKPAESFEQSIFITRPTVESLTPYYAQYTNGLFDNKQYASWLARIVWVMDDIATGIKRHILPGDINTINVLLDVFNQPFFEEITGLPISFDTKLGKITITDSNKIKLDFTPLPVEPSIVQEKAKNFIRLLKELPLENLQKNCVLGLMRRYLEATGALNELKASNKSFSRMARKHFAEEGQTDKNFLGKKDLDALKNLSETLQKVSNNGLSKPTTNQEFYEQNKKLFIRAFEAEKQQTPTDSAMVEFIKEYCKNHRCDNIVDWLVEGKEPSNKSTSSGSVGNPSEKK